MSSRVSEEPSLVVITLVAYLYCDNMHMTKYLSFYPSVKIFTIRRTATGLLYFLCQSQTTTVQVPLKTVRQNKTLIL